MNKPKILNTFRLSEYQFFDIWAFNFHTQLTKRYEIYKEDCLIHNQEPFHFREFTAMIFQKHRNLIDESIN